MKIGFINPKSYTSGGSVYIDYLINGLKKQGVDTVLVEYPINKYGIVVKKPCINLKKLKNCDVLHLLAEHAFLFKRIKKRKVTTVYHLVFNEKYLKHASFAQKIYYAAFLKKYIQKSLNTVNRVIAMSDYTKESTIKIFGERDVKRIYPGIDTKKFKPQEKDRNDNKIRLLFVGNLIKRKGVDLLPRIMNELGDRYILYYTTGLRTGNILRHKKMLPLGKLRQSSGELIDEYNKCDIFLFPTRLEGFGYAVAEAMACAKPVVTTNCSSLPELIVNGKGGFLCEMDNVDDFVAKIKILGADENLRKRMGEFNRKRVLKKFTLERSVKEHIKFYKQLIKEKKR